MATPPSKRRSAPTSSKARGKKASSPSTSSKSKKAQARRMESFTKRRSGRLRPWGVDPALDDELEKNIVKFEKAYDELREKAKSPPHRALEAGRIGLSTERVKFTDKIRNFLATRSDDTYSSDVVDKLAEVQAELEHGEGLLRTSEGQIVAWKGVGQEEFLDLHRKAKDAWADVANAFRKKKSNIELDRQAADRTLEQLAFLGLNKNTNDPIRKEVREWFYNTTPEQRAKAVDLLTNAEKVSYQNSPTKQQRSKFLGNVLKSFAMDTRKHDADAFDADSVDFGLLPEFIDAEPKKIRDRDKARDLLERVEESIRTFGQDVQTPTEVRSLEELTKLKNQLEEREKELSEQEKLARMAQPRIAALRRKEAELEQKVEAAKNKNLPLAEQEAKNELASVRKNLSNLENRIATREVSKDKLGRTPERALVDNVRTRFQNWRVGLRAPKEKSALAQKVEKATKPVREEVKESWSAGLMSARNKVRALRLRNAEDDSQQHARVARSKWWAAYYQVANKMTFLRAMFLLLGVLFVPWGLAHFVGWTFFGIFTFIVNAFYAVIIEVANLMSQGFVMGVNFVGNLLASLVNWAGHMINTVILGQPFSAYYFSLAGVRLQPTPLVDPLLFFPQQFNTNSWFSVVMDAVGLTSVADVFRTGGYRIIGENFEPLRQLIEARLREQWPGGGGGG